MATSPVEAQPIVDELDPDEPRTPLWLPLVGLPLLFAAIALWIALPSDEPRVEESAEAAPAETAQPAAAPAPTPAPTPARPNPARRRPPTPGG